VQPPPKCFTNSATKSLKPLAETCISTIED
jgi:hypothetical protein